MNRIGYTSALVATSTLLAVSGAAHAASPTQADFDACNREAKAQVTSPAASPGTAGRGVTGGTGSGTGSTMPGSLPSPSGPGVSGSVEEPLQGMAAAGTTDPAYQQSYRDCMRRRGF